MDYDMSGVPLKQYGKRRPKTPTTFKCECGSDVLKVSYGLYRCMECSNAYEYQYGKLVKGNHYIDDYDYGGFQKKKPRLVCSFPLIKE